jgi:hypothetical protein
MATPVTDPALISQLNAMASQGAPAPAAQPSAPVPAGADTETAGTASSPPKIVVHATILGAPAGGNGPGIPVTDPVLIQQLNAMAAQTVPAGPEPTAPTLKAPALNVAPPIPQPVAAAPYNPVMPQTPGATGNNPMARQAPAPAAAPSPNYQPSAVPFLDRVNAFASGAIDQVPFLGPALDNVANTGDAWINNALGFAPQTPQDRAAVNAADQAQYPAENIAGRVAGAVVPLAAVGSTELGGALLGQTGPIAARVGAGMASGAVINGGDTLVRTGDPNQALQSAGIGLVGGAVLPIAENAARAGYRAITGTGVGADVAKVARAMVRDGLTPQQASVKMAQMGPDAILADAGPNLQNQAAAVYTAPGRGKDVLETALKGRAQAAVGRIRAMLENTTGKDIAPSDIEASIRAEMEKVGEEYTPLFAHAKPVDVKPIVAKIDADIKAFEGDAKTGMRTIRKMFDEAAPVPNTSGVPASVQMSREAFASALKAVGGDINKMNLGAAVKSSGLTSDPAKLFEIRHAIDVMIGKETSGQVQGRLLDVRKIVDKMLEASVPGIKQVDARYGDLAEQVKALKEGAGILDGGKTALRPSELADRAQTSKGIWTRLVQGSRAEIYRIVGQNANDVQALNRLVGGEGDWNRAKLVTLFGQTRADKILNVLKSESHYSQTANKVLGGSDTVAKAAGQADVAAPAVNIPSSANISGMLFSGASKGLNRLLGANHEAMTAKMASWLAGPMTPEKQALLERAQQLSKQRGFLPAPSLPLVVQNQLQQPAQ